MTTKQVYLSVVAFMLLLLGIACEAQLSSMFYNNTCPNALSIIRTVIRAAVSKERRMAASLIRLHFHDCFVQVRTITKSCIKMKLLDIIEQYIN